MGKYNFRRTKNIFIFTESGYSSSDRSQCSIGRYNNALVRHIQHTNLTVHTTFHVFCDIDMLVQHSTLYNTSTEQNLRHCFLGTNLTDFFILSVLVFLVDQQ